MTLTIEPGLYFIEAQLKRASEDPNISKFIVWDVIQRFRNFGGVSHLFDHKIDVFVPNFF
jgi:Xaa-Pro dipeptidase